MTLQVTRPDATTLVVTRFFAASPARVWAAHMEPALIRQWMIGEGGTTMPVCENDPRVGGQLNFEWREPDGSGFSVRGTYELVEPHRRTIHVETMFLPDPMPQNRIETRFDAEKSGTRLTLTMTLPDAASADALSTSGIADGMAGCYAILEGLLSPTLQKAPISKR